MRKGNIGEPSIRQESWKRLKNKDLIRSGVLEIGDGYRAKNSEMGMDGLPFARAGNIKGRLDFDGADILSAKSVARAKEKVSQAGDVVITTKGTFGRVALVRPETEQFVYSPQLCYWRVKDSSIIHPHFLYYWIQGPDFLGQAFKVKSSTDMADYANLRDQRMMSIGAPPLPTQRKIAAILSAYDELIENNRRRIALLERLAEEIYCEWFVRLRFPGHEEVKVVKGVPEGWEVKKLGEVLDLNYGKALKQSDRLPGQYYVYGSGGIVGTHNEALIHEAGLIVGRKGNVGSVYWSDKGFYPIDTVYYVTSDLSNSFLYFLLQSMNFVNNDSAVPGLNRKQAYSNLMILPSRDMVGKFARTVDPLFELKSMLTDQNRSLNQTRDLLLPRLISGKLSVEDLDIAFPPGMADEVPERATGQQELTLDAELAQ